MSEQYMKTLFSGIPSKLLENLVALDDLIPLVLAGESKLPEATTSSPDAFMNAIDDWLGEAVAESLINEQDRFVLYDHVMRFSELMRLLRARRYTER